MHETTSDRDDDGPPGGALARARALLDEARRVLVLTGAGVSAASGMPTFRGEDGLWKDRRPEELATPEAFARDPRAVWEWYGWRRRMARECDPNPAHLWIARWCVSHPDVTLVTQNVDSLHRRALESVAPDAAAVERASPVELHGDLFRVRCAGCGRRAPHEAEVDATSRETLPRCQRCGELLRPDVVWFGESLEAEMLEAAFAAAERAEACLVVGTSAVVQPAASLATTAAGAGAAVVEINPETTPASRVAEVSLRADAARAVPALLRPLLEGDGGSGGSGAEGA